jgi:glutathione S-transferase
MIEIYHAPRTRSNRVVWLCEEMGLPYTVHLCEILKPPPEIVEKNPGGTYPLTLDGDVVLFESVVTLEYLTETYGPTDLVIGRDEPGYWDYRQVLHWGEATLAAPINAIVGTAYLAPEDQRHNITSKVITLSMKKRLGLLADRLKSSDYVAGNRFTIADISAAYAVILALRTEILGLKDLIAEDLIAYAQRLIDRPAYQRMLKVK